MTDPRRISIKDFNYSLPAEKIAFHPLPERDASRLLVYKNGKITEDVYSNIANYIPQNSLLVFNDTKVINARLRFKKSSGGIIEIFCLEPYNLSHDYNTIMSKTGTVSWKCFIGGAAKWKQEELEKQLTIDNIQLTIKARLLEKLPDAYVIRFSWTPATYSFAEIIESAGDIPLPPYIKRETNAADATRYQTIYSKHEGSVAAPTAGLHFTENIFKRLSEKNIEKASITLHVGAGTFKPVKAAVMEEHKMHAEWIDVTMETIRNILCKKDKVIAVGTTSARTIETLYWLGVKVLLNQSPAKLQLAQWEIYDAPLKDCDIKVEDALQALINWMVFQKQNRLFTQTQLLITPGYTFKIVKALITNFHQPQSTLLLLVAAATGDDWKRIYNYALENNFRFLSYGDGNLIFIDPSS